MSVQVARHPGGRPTDRDDPLVSVTLRIPRSLHDKIVGVQQSRGLSWSAAVRLCIERGFKADMPLPDPWDADDRRTLSEALLIIDNAEMRAIAAAEDLHRAVKMLGALTGDGHDG